MYQNILVAMDGSALSRKALQGAISVAGAVGADLVALHVVPRYPTSLFEGNVAWEPDEVARIEMSVADKGQAIADGAVRDAAKAGVKARGLVTQSDHVAEAILAAARKHKCDLVVMAAHGRRGIRRLLMGSETQHVLTHGTIPVLIVR
jgi:nucleotide-binding universal stress UspA family protein